MPNKPKIEKIKKAILIPPPIPIALLVLLNMQEDKKQMPDIANVTAKLPKTYNKIS